jgi:predicted DNA-binding transcriptional regulator AlpA
MNRVAMPIEYDKDAYLRTNEVAALLSVHRSTLNNWRLMDEREHLRGWNAPPSFRFGRNRFYKRSALQKWLEGMNVPAEPQHEETK